MPFPDTPRVVYKENPLERVVCQLRFPPILRIDAEIPADFQESIRHEFPEYQEASNVKIEVPPEIRSSMPPEVLKQFVGEPVGRNHEFLSEDGQWKVNLTRSFVALSTENYDRWEEFKAKLMIPLEAVIEVYSPLYYSRVGLRYIDVIKRSVLGLDNVSWAELLSPPVAGVLKSEIEEYVSAFESRYEIGLSDGTSIVRMVTRFVESVEDGERCYMIDSDFFNRGRTEVGEVIGKLDYFNLRGSRVFQWCISTRLHEAMGGRVI